MEINKNNAPVAVKRKIAVVSDAVYPFNKGGKEKRIYEITTRLAALGHEITIYCMKWWPEGKILVKDGVVLEAISPFFRLYAGERRSLRQAFFFALNCLKLLKEKFDIIEVDHIPHPVLFAVKLVCLIKRKPMIALWHEVWGKEYWREYLPGWGYLAYLIEKLSSRLPDTIISVSNHTTGRLQNILGRKNGITTIANGIDLKKLRGISPSRRTSDLVFTGRLLKHKNVDVLLRAVQIVKKSRLKISLVIVGEGPEKNSLRELAQKLGIEDNVAFLDFIDDDKKLYAILKASRIFVLPSTREGFGIVVIEANACGLPVIVVDNEQNAAKDLIVAGENGRSCALDEARMADVISQLLDSRQEPEFYIKYAEPYDWENIITKTREVYEL